MKDETVTEEQEERGLAEPWLDRIRRAESVLQEWQDCADNIDKSYADLSNLRSAARDRDFALFWSNIQVLGPSIYARPPVPVVTPKFKDRRPLYRTSSEFLERVCTVSFDMADIDSVMLGLRDDLSIVGRGAGWIRFESDDDEDKVCVEHLDRHDFVHDCARKWSEVDWVARRAWMTKEEMRERFGDAADEVNYTSPIGEDKGKYGHLSEDDSCGVWEIWCKSKEKVIWVSEGYDKVLDERDPYLSLSCFWPTPKPVYSTVQRSTLVPVPDMLQYKDQLEEITALTRRIHTLSDAIKLRGFYAGGSDIGAAVERAVTMADDDQILVPVPNLGSLAASGGAQPIIWMPLEMVASTITGLIELRRQIIDDVYQIIGLSDIMRGATEASETLGAQQLKQQNGSYRVRDKQNELIRWARDAVRIAAEIMAEEFDRSTLEEMAQMDLPTDKDIEKQIEQVEGQAEAVVAQAQEAMQQAAQQGPEAAQEIQQQAQQQIQQFQEEIGKLQDTVTIDQVMEFLRDEKLRPYVLDIETDSTIYPDEAAEKASRAEFMNAFSASMSSLAPMFAMGPEAISVAGGVFKFALAPYRVGRELEGLIDDFVDQGPAIAERMQSQEGEGEDEGLAAAQMKLAEAEMAKVESQTAANQAQAQLKMQELQLKAAEAQEKASQSQQEFALSVQDAEGRIAKTQADIEKIHAEIQLAQQKLGLDAQKADQDALKTAAELELKAADQDMRREENAHQRLVGAQDRQYQAYKDMEEARNTRNEGDGNGN